MRGVGTRLLAAALAVSVGMSAGCAPIFVGGTKLPVTRAPSAETTPVKPKVAVLAWTSPLTQFYWPQGLQIHLEKEMEASVRKVTEASGLFRSFSLDPDPDADCVIHVYAEIVGRHLGPGWLPYIFLAALTLGVFPLPHPNDVVLRATVARQDGTVLKSYRLEGSITEVHEILLFIFLPLGWVLTAEHAAKEVFEELMGALYREIEADHVLSLQ